MRQRAKEHIPAVLLTLLSIVQALALELLWSHLISTPLTFTISLIALITWLQIGITFLGIVLVWAVYVSNVMRFRWVPTMSDTVYPFLVGLFEFALVATLGTAHLHIWFYSMAGVVALMTWISHLTFVQARRDPDNAVFFADVERARWQDFAPQIGIVAGLAIAGIYIGLTSSQSVFALVTLTLTALVLGWQFYRTARYWTASVADKPHGTA